MTIGRWHIPKDQLAAATASFLLIVSAVGFVYVAGAMKAPQRLASAAIDTALLLYVIAGTDIPQKIRASLALRRQLLIWAAWLMILGVAPAINSQMLPPAVTALVAGVFMSAVSVGALMRAAGHER